MEVNYDLNILTIDKHMNEERNLLKNMLYFGRSASNYVS